MRVVVFGKNGQVARALQSANAELIMLGRDDTDLLLPGAARAAIQKTDPQVVINAAAYTAVDKAETEPEAARRLNTEAPAEMAEAAAQLSAPFLHISTDYVFDGVHAGRLTEESQTTPINKYGATKLAGEEAVMRAHQDAVILRTSWVFSEHGANFVKTMLRLAEARDALNVVADQTGGPTAAADIAATLLLIAGKKHRGAPGAGIYHYQGAPPVSWAGFAQKIFEAAGKPVKVSHIKTEEYPTPARRPLNTVLDCARIERDFGIAQPDWRPGLERVISALNNEGQY
ncbi:dTDP-4-dehydrorhamnose reductase [Hyphococcus sp.]|uniref:dTDP-4-dehydrorhamnose reductase n=1 Tax=Hyphococcus sp. TaxID=2038636 RepID=UPI0020850FA6|nr:MAG: NAD(P)-dependent oxidoreductase [Marinicaulis sp.]